MGAPAVLLSRSRKAVREDSFCGPELSTISLGERQGHFARPAHARSDHAIGQRARRRRPDQAPPVFQRNRLAKIASAELPPPWEPHVVGSLDTSQFDREFTSMPILSPEAKDCKLGSLDDTFQGFSYSTSAVGHAPPGSRPV